MIYLFLDQHNMRTSNNKLLICVVILLVHVNLRCYFSRTCKEPGMWDDIGVMCEDCDVWYHMTCQNISISSYSCNFV